MSKKTSKKASRQQRRARQRRQKQLKQAVSWGAGLLVIALAVLFVWRSSQSAPGESYPILPASHVPPGTDPGTYNSNPPTSGPHYPQEFSAGFYDETSPQTQEPYPAGFLMHNLEHGYVIFWYNCDALPDGDCEGLKAQIRATMQKANRPKLVAFPWPSLDVPVALTSWGRLLRLERYDGGAALAFVNANYNRAPEPGAP